MTTKHAIVAMLAIGLLIALATAASAQTPTTAPSEVLAPATLADVAMPSSVIVDAFVQCMKATGKEKTCRKLAEREADRSEGTANSASKAVRPVVVNNGYGSYYSPYVWGTAHVYTRNVRPLRRGPVVRSSAPNAGERTSNRQTVGIAVPRGTSPQAQAPRQAQGNYGTYQPYGSPR